MTKRTRLLTRRQAVGAAGALGAGAVGVVQGIGLAAPSGAAEGACSLTPEATEGAFHIEDAAFRSDINEGKPGTPLRLELTSRDLTAGDRLRVRPGASYLVGATRPAPRAGDPSPVPKTIENPLRP